MNIEDTLKSLLEVDGAMAAAVVDSESGMMLGSAGSQIDLEVAAAGNTEVVRAKLKAIKAQGKAEEIEDILITLTTQYHILRPLVKRHGIFLYFVLDKSKSNLALARRKLQTAENEITI